MVGGKVVKTKSDFLDVSPTLEILPGSGFIHKQSMKNLRLYCGAVSMS